jgi:tRNA-specific 2-thiouridylase
MNSNKKVILGLSGGVDSAVSAVLLKGQGYDVHAVYLTCWKQPGCRADLDRADAMKVALQLNLPFQVLDFRKEYKEQVMDYFYREYKEGRTPNPDVLCNSIIKFGLFYNWALKEGYKLIASGHYAKIFDEHLVTPKDRTKDQTYFLYRLRKDQLLHILFPLGNYLKTEVRELARKHKLVVADKDDSMGICFVGDVNVREMLRQKYGIKKGEVQLSDGTVVGEHGGYWLFTIGFRGGWRRKGRLPTGRFKNDELPKLYVTDIKKEENVVVVGEREEAMKTEFEISNVHWIEKVNGEDSQVFVKVRNTGDFLSATLSKTTGGGYSMQLKKPEFGISPGQSCVLYKKSKEQAEIPLYVVLGGGVIR